MKLNTNQKTTHAADTEAKAGLLNFITENNGKYYEVGIQMKSPIIQLNTCGNFWSNWKMSTKSRTMQDTALIAW